jgi:hypothetical protein
MADRVLSVDVGDGAQMTVPTPEWCWNLRYSTDKSAPPVCSDRMLAASVCASFLHLISRCTKKDAWHRIKIMRAAIEAEIAKEKG